MTTPVIAFSESGMSITRPRTVFLLQPKRGAENTLGIGHAEPDDIDRGVARHRLVGGFTDRLSELDLAAHGRAHEADRDDGA